MTDTVPNSPSDAMSGITSPTENNRAETSRDVSCHAPANAGPGHDSKGRADGAAKAEDGGTFRIPGVQIDEASDCQEDPYAGTTSLPLSSAGLLSAPDSRGDRAANGRANLSGTSATDAATAFAFRIEASRRANAALDPEANIVGAQINLSPLSLVDAGGRDAEHDLAEHGDPDVGPLDDSGFDASVLEELDGDAEASSVAGNELTHDNLRQWAHSDNDDSYSNGALVPLEPHSNDLPRLADKVEQKEKLIFAVAVSALIAGLEAIRLPAADLPDGEQPPARKKSSTGKKLSTAKTPSVVMDASARPCFTMHKAKDHLRLRLQSGRIKVETKEIALASAPEASAEEAQFILTDAALFELFPEKDLDDLEWKAAPSSPSPEPVIIFEVEQEHPVMFVTFGKARIPINIKCTEITAPIMLPGIAPTSSDLISTHTLATSLLIASTFKLPPSRSTRQQVSRLNSITCADGAVRGGNGVAFTSVESDQLKPFSFSVHRRDVRALAHLLRSAGKRSFFADQTRAQFVDANRVIELEQPELEFIEMDWITDRPDGTSTEYPVQMMAVLDACSAQSAIQLRHDINVPYSTTLAFNGDRDGNLVLRSRSIDGRSEALSRVSKLGANSAQEAVYVTIAFKDFYGALGSARPNDKVEIGLKNRCLIVSLSNGDRTTKHYLPTSLKPPLAACRWEEHA